MAGAFAPRVLSLALEMAGPQSVIIPFLVSPEFGVDSRAVARRELKRKLDELGVSTSQKIVPQIGIDGKAAQGIVRAAADCRLVILGGSNPSALAKIKSMGAQNAGSDRGARPAMALIRPMTVATDSVRPSKRYWVRRPGCKSISSRVLPLRAAGEIGPIVICLLVVDARCC